MRRNLIGLTLAALLAALTFPLLPGAGDAEARVRGVKFFVVDWRLSWEEGAEELTLQLKGRTRGGSGDLGEEFEMATKDTAPIMSILETCAMGRMQGTATVLSNSNGKVTGEALTSLTCRAILK